MKKSTVTIPGDTIGASYHLDVLRFSGRDGDAPKAYLQAALHANELPGVAALHYLIPMLGKAEAEERLLGEVTIVPKANPIGGAQYLFHEHAGRFSLASRVNFNRDFPVPRDGGGRARIAMDAPVAAEKRLKSLLLDLAEGHDIVLDLHCDDEGLSYLYIPAPLWPHMRDLAACLGSAGVIVWGETSDAAFEEAALLQIADIHDGTADWPRKAVSTMELRGRADVAPDTAAHDAEGLYRFLVARGVVSDPMALAPGDWHGVAAAIENVEMMHAPASGTLLYHVQPGDTVKAGDRLVTIVIAPGEEGGVVEVTAPQDGLILTRRVHRVTSLGDDLLKLVGSRRSANAKSGTLEA
jgi:predicted deacylase